MYLAFINIKNIFNNIYEDNDLLIMLHLQAKLVKSENVDARAVVIEIAKTASLTIFNKNVQYMQVLKTLKGKMMLCKMTGRRGKSKSWAKLNSCHVLNIILKNQRKNRVSAVDFTK